jgi:hypothetical protein
LVASAGVVGVFFLLVNLEPPSIIDHQRQVIHGPPKVEEVIGIP